jgi:hypothetical protein
VLTDGQTSRQTYITKLFAFRNFSKEPKNKTHTVLKTNSKTFSSYVTQVRKSSICCYAHTETKNDFVPNTLQVRSESCEERLLASSFHFSHSVRLSLFAWYDSAATRRIFTYSLTIFRTNVQKIHVLLKSDNNKGHFICRCLFIMSR